MAGLSVFDYVRQALVDKGIPFKVLQHKPEINTSCPFCGDTRNRLYINYKKRIGWCHNEASVIPFANILKWLGLEKESRSTSSALHKVVKTIKKRFSKFKRKSHKYCPKEWNVVKIKLPPESLPIPKSSWAFKYLRGRGIGSDLIEKYDLRFCREGHYENRIIIPVWDDSKHLMAFQARDYLGSRGPKYLFPVGSRMGMTFFNAEYLHQHKDVVIVEGVFPAMTLGENYLASFGKKISQGQFDMLMRNDVRSITFLWDADAIKEAEAAAEKLSQWFHVSVVKLPYGQPDSFPIENIYRRVSRANSFEPLRNVVEGVKLL